MKKVVLYGKSLVMYTIGASLHDCPDLQLLPLDPALPDANQQLEKLEPDAVIFSMGIAHPESLLSFLQHPDVLLIGVDPETHQALVWTATRRSCHSIPGCWPG